MQRICLFQPAKRLFIVPFVDKMVPFGNQVTNRAAGANAAPGNARVAEGHAAVHAARGLRLNARFALGGMERIPILNPLLTRLLGSRLAVIF